MSNKILVPTLGESITEATVSKWLKSKGEKVNSDEPLVELETDKVNIEVPAPSNGVLETISAKEGQTVNVGATLGTIGQSKMSVEKKNFKVSLPIIKKDNQMNFYSWSKNHPLKINKFGIPEPVSSKVFYPDILLVPLVAYDSSLNRLGYGGGYYDRYIEKIEKIKKITKIGLAFSFQKISTIPINQYDKRLDFIVTEKEITK